MNLNKIPNDIDFLVVDCASCYSTLIDYSDLTDIELKPKINNLQEKIIHINQLLLKLDIKFDTEKSLNLLPVTYHVPCHLKRYKGLTAYSKTLINKIVNIEFNEMKEEDRCCGMSGTFMVCNSSLSKKITFDKITNITDTKSKLVVTDCSGCKIGLIKGIVENQLDFPVLQPVELLAKLYLVTK
jgi:glycolate oxidase iron-sulfur subunit